MNGALAPSNPPAHLPYYRAKERPDARPKGGIFFAAKGIPWIPIFSYTPHVTLGNLEQVKFLYVP